MPKEFTFRHEGSGHIFSIFADKTSAIKEILRLKHEINLFVFSEFENVTYEKAWFYTGDGQVIHNHFSKRKCS